MKKLTYIISSLIFFYTLFSCEKEYEPAGPEANKICIRVPSASTQIHETLTFGDLSSGVNSRLWTFPTSAKVTNSEGNTSTEAIVSASFTEPGFYQVKLHMEFGESLIENGAYSGQTSADSILIIEILDSVHATFNANYVSHFGPDSIAMDVSDDAANDLWAGEYVRFTSTMHGMPANFAWYFEGGTPEFYEGTDSTILVQYRTLGSYSVFHLAYRENPTSYDTTLVANLINVIPTGRRASLVSSKKIDATTIELEFTIGMKGSTDIADDFELSVTNDEDGNIPGIVVTNVEIDEDEPYKLRLTLNDGIYDDDSTYISFTKNTLEDEFDNLVPGFEFARVQSVLYNPIPEEMDAGFETNPTLWSAQNWEGTIYNPSNTEATISTTEKHSGESSIKITTSAGGGSAVQSPASYAIEEGAGYKMSFWMLIEEKGEPFTGDNLTNAGLYNGDWVNGFSNYLVETQTAEEGWQYYTHVLYPTPEDPSALYPLIRAHNPDGSTPLVFYIDDITMERFDERTRP